jgi:predicted nuclease with TOPRIM domain|tara:strand:+ start:397 stop:609 length:213 start_codon:yes stop_codon:yes gene_type:complete
MDDRGPADLERRIDDLKERIDQYESLDKQELIDRLTITKAQLLNCEKEIDRLFEENNNLITMFGGKGGGK